MRMKERLIAMAERLIKGKSVKMFQWHDGVEYITLPEMYGPYDYTIRAADYTIDVEIAIEEWYLAKGNNVIAMRTSDF